jgi:hypothetical protein
MYLAYTLSSHFIKGQPTKSTFEEEFDQVPLTAEINRIIATEEKISKLKFVTQFTIYNLFKRPILQPRG